MNKIKNFVLSLIPLVQKIGVNVTGQELFDEYEINGGGANEEGWIQMVAETSTPWHTEKINPLLYNGYPFHPDLIIDWRTPVEELGVPPVFAISIGQNLNTSLKLTESDINTGTVSSKTRLGAIEYNLPYNMYYDYYHLVKEAANIGADNPAIRNLLNSPFPPITSGTYPVQLLYRLPGTGEVTSRVKIEIRRP